MHVDASTKMCPRERSVGGQRFGSLLTAAPDPREALEGADRTERSFLPLAGRGFVGSLRSFERNLFRSIESIRHTLICAGLD